MHRPFWIVFAFVLVGVCGWGVLPLHDPSVAEGDSSRTGAKSDQDRAPSSNGSPKAVVDKTEFDFGLMDMTEDCAHTFIIHNRGNGPLKLNRGPTTCKCTMSDLPARPIPPGGRAPVRVASKLDNRTGPFSHGAKILTNDPANETIELRIRGTIRKFLAKKPPRLVLRASRGEQSPATRVLLYSEVWSDFRVDAVQTSLDGLQWNVAETDQKESIGPHARGCVELEITLPPKLPSGDFWEPLQITVIPDEKPDSKFTTTLDLTGSVAARFSLYGERLRKGKVIELGTLRTGRGARAKTLLKVRDDHRRVTFGRIAVEPPFLQTHVVPKGPAGEKLGLYEISVEVPPNSPACSYRGKTRGQVRIETDHPDLPLLELDVDFAILH